MTLCNINQGRLSLFREVKLSDNSSLLDAVLRQAYFGHTDDLDADELVAIKAVFASEDVVKKGMLTDSMGEIFATKDEAMHKASAVWSEWKLQANKTFVAEAGWFFKTLAVQELGKISSKAFRFVMATLSKKKNTTKL